MKETIMLKFVIVLSFFLTNYCCACEHVILKIPNLDKEQIVAYSTGLRPYRKNGIRLEAETIDNKLIIHNYGHGGSGISLSWGCAQEAINIMKLHNNQGSNIAVLGAGVIGLTTAYILKSQGYSVTIYAREFVPQTTSNKAAGIWSADFGLSSMDETLYTRLKNVSYSKFQELATDNKSEIQGVFILPSYTEKDQFKIDDPLPDSHCVVSCNGVAKVCKKSSNIVFDLNIYMQDLFDQVRHKEVDFQYKNIESIKDLLQLPEDIIFNCSGLGSREIFNDTMLVPIKGHLVKFTAQPEIDFIVSKWHQKKDTFFSLIPWKTQLVLGGTMEKGVENLDIDEQKINDLIESAKNFFNITS
jgi:glycine/D-amino acid oxidase-like deaminating enzyme